MSARLSVTRRPAALPSDWTVEEPDSLSAAGAFFGFYDPTFAASVGVETAPDDATAVTVRNPRKSDADLYVTRPDDGGASSVMLRQLWDTDPVPGDNRGAFEWIWFAHDDQPVWSRITGPSGPLENFIDPTTNTGVQITPHAVGQLHGQLTDDGLVLGENDGPAVPNSSSILVFSRKNFGGKMELCAQAPSGAAVVLWTEA